MKKLRVYRVRCRVVGGGGYVPPDPCAGGDYHRDRYDTFYITCTSAKRARELVAKDYEGEDIKMTVHSLGDV